MVNNKKTSEYGDYSKNMNGAMREKSNSKVQSRSKKQHNNENLKWEKRSKIKDNHSKKSIKDKGQKDVKKMVIMMILGFITLLVLIIFFKWLFFDRVVSKEEISLSSDEGINLVYKVNSYSYFDLLSSYDSKDLTNQQKLWFVVRTDDLIFKELKFYEEGVSVSKNDVQTFYNRFFSGEIENEDILCSIDNKPIFEYSEENGTYTYTTNYEHSHDAELRIYDKYYYPVGVYKYKRADGKVYYEVEVNKMFGDYCTDVCGITKNFYGTYEDSLNKENAIIESSNFDNWDYYFISGGNEMEILYEQYKNEFPVYKYRFVLRDDNYYLDSVNISK